MTADAAPLRAAVADAAVATPDAALRRILRNAAALLGAYVVPRALTFAAALVAARILGPSGFGAYSTAASFAMVMSVVATLGMQPLLIREFARRPDDAASLLHAARSVKLVSGLVMLGMLGIATALLDYSPQVTLAALVLGCGYICVGFGENLNAWFQARERMHIWLQASILFGVVSGGLGIIALLATGSVTWFCAALAAGQLASLSWLRLRFAADGVHAGGAVADVRALVREAAPFAAAFFFLTLYYKLDVLLLQRLQPIGIVGAYAAGYKLVDVAQAVVVVACGALYPRLARITSGEERRRASQRTLEIFLLGAIPVSTLLWLVRAPLITLLFGSSYSATISVMAWLAPALIVLVVNTLGWYLLSAADRPGSLALSYVIATVLKGSLGLLLMPRLGADGAAMGMLASEVSVACLIVLLLVRGGAASIGMRTLVLAAAAVSVAPLIATLFGPLPAAFVYLVFVCALYFAGHALRRDEWQALTASLRPAA